MVKLRSVEIAVPLCVRVEPEGKLTRASTSVQVPEEMVTVPLKVKGVV
mgnify:CR=1 FL=1